MKNFFKKDKSSTDLAAVADNKSASKSADKVTEADGKKSLIILAPIVSEKSTGFEASGLYTFWVAPKANKQTIAKAIFEIYAVKPTNVRVSNLEGKVRRFGRNEGRTSDRKKAFVQLPKGKTISVHKGV